MKNNRKTVIISGGCGSVGRAVGKKLSETGFNIVALYFTTPHNEAEAVIKDFAAGDHCVLACDIRDEESVRAMLAAVQKEYGSIDVVVHTAVGKILRKNILEIGHAELQDQFETGLFGGFYFLAGAARIIREQKTPGVIVGVLSQVVMPGARSAKMAGYAVGKYALRGLLKELYNELSSSLVTVAAVAPDFMDTKLNHDLPPAVRSFIAERGTTGSITSPEAVAEAIAFLCSPDGYTMNGKIFSFDPGEIQAL